MVYGISSDFGQKNIFRNACFVNPNTDNNTDIFTIAKNNRDETTQVDTKKETEKNNKYWEAAMNIADCRNAVYNQISKYTGISEYNDFPPEAKAIADKINDFCNGMTAGKLAQAKNSDDIDSEIKKCIEEVKAKQQECLEELKQLYEAKNSSKTDK
jgi:copper chaperone CopZ